MKKKFWFIYSPIILALVLGIYVTSGYTSNLPLVLSDDAMSSISGSTVYTDMYCNKNIGYCDTIACTANTKMTQTPIAAYEGCMSWSGHTCETLLPYSYCLQVRYDNGCDQPPTGNYPQNNLHCQ